MNETPRPAYAPSGTFTSTQTSGLAISSMVLGIMSFFCSIFTALPAILMGVIALRRINRSQGRLDGSGMAIAGITTGAVGLLFSVPLMVALLLPAVQAAREAARRNQSLSNIKQIQIALLNHEMAKGAFPAAGGGEGPGGQLSWRVHVLPYLEEVPLYTKFHLDEAWDSPHNRELIKLMPAVYKDPNLRVGVGETMYLAITGPGTAFGDGTTAATLKDFRDGASATAMVVEANPEEAVEWTKPEDWQFDPSDPKRGLGRARPGGFIVIFADGHTEFIPDMTDSGAIKSMMTRDAGD